MGKIQKEEKKGGIDFQLGLFLKGRSSIEEEKGIVRSYLFRLLE